LKKIKKIVLIAFHGAYDTSTPEGRANERARRIALTAVTAAMSKVLSMAIPLITVRITYSYLGEETYGLWSTVTSFFSLFTFADLGLGNGIQTRLSQASGLDDENLCKKIISSAYSMLVIVASALMVVFLFVYPFINWGAVMNAKTENAIALAGGVVLAIVASKLLCIPLTLVQRTQMALQEGYRSNLWQCAASALSLVLVYIVSGLDLGPLAMIWASSMIVVIVSALNMLVYYCFQRKDLCPKVKNIDKLLAGSLLKTGFAFLVLSILTTVGLSIDNFIVARACSLSEAATYSILYKVAYLISVTCTMLSTPMWAANGEAMARGELNWVKRNTKKMAMLSLVLSTLATVGVLVLSKPLFRLWIGEKFKFSIFLLLGMCVMQIVLSFISPYFMVLNASGIVKKQIVVFAIYTPISFGLKYILAKRYGVIAIPWVGVLLYCLIIILPIFVIVNNRMNKKID